MDTEYLGQSIIIANNFEGLIIYLAIRLNYPHNPVRQALLHNISQVRGLRLKSLISRDLRC